MKRKTLIEPFRIKVVEPIHMTTETYREEALIRAGYNPFLLHSDDVIIDLLTDSGTSAMSDRQWSAMMVGDESYAGARSWEKLFAEVSDLTSMPFVLPTHQGRAAERILYGILGGKGKVFLSNTHFDTTRANIEFTGAEAYDLMPEESYDPELYLPFKGNIDLNKLQRSIDQFGTENIAAVIMTVTNNSAGGQPVSMQNMKAVREICDRHGILLVLDGCRIAENSFFIHEREDGYQKKNYREIAREMLRLADVFVMSAKKDALVNMGGLLAMRSAAMAEKCTNLLIISEGFATYGGLTGRDMEAIAVGLREVFDESYLRYRIRSTTYLGEHLREKGVPVVWPIGGHAVYVDAQKIYPHIPAHEFPGQALVCELYKRGGIRCVEIGSVMFGKYDDNGKMITSRNELVRLAIPRRVYTQSHIDYVVEVFDDILATASEVHGFKIEYEPPFLRHFTARFKPLAESSNKKNKQAEELQG
ncbi:MAG: tryptophanase [Flavobacteriales bacterium]|nr:tryptophanase [Flavobacteriales bacterium]